jgi:hypothetical protein
LWKMTNPNIVNVNPSAPKTMKKTTQTTSKIIKRRWMNKKTTLAIYQTLSHLLGSSIRVIPTAE